MSVKNGTNANRRHSHQQNLSLQCVNDASKFTDFAEEEGIFRQESDEEALEAARSVPRSHI